MEGIDDNKKAFFNMVEGKKRFKIFGYFEEEFFKKLLDN